jgi:hypothetical protein
MYSENLFLWVNYCAIYILLIRGHLRVNHPVIKRSSNSCRLSRKSLPTVVGCLVNRCRMRHRVCLFRATSRAESKVFFGPLRSNLNTTTVLCCRSRDSSVGIATGYALNNQGVGVRVPVGSRIFFLHVVQTGSEVHPSSYPMGTGGSFSGGKAVGV